MKSSGAGAVKRQQSDPQSLLLESQSHQAQLEAQRALAESRDRYVDLYEFAPVAYLTLTADGLISQTNRAGAALLGVERTRLLKRRFASFVAATDRERCRRELVEALRQDSKRIIDLTLQRRDGTRHQVILDSRRTTGEGEAPLLRITLTDITECNYAERAQRETEHLRSQILDSVLSSIAVLDHDGFIVATNASWRRFALENSPAPGMPASRTDVGVNYLEVCRTASGDRSEGAREARDGIRAVLDGRLPRFSLVYTCHSPSEKRWFALSAIRLGGENPGVIVSHSDVSELHEKERALMALRAEMQHLLEWEVARQTVAAIAHELGQPLAGISALCEAATRLLDPARAAAPGQIERILRLMAAASEAAGGKLRELIDTLRAPPIKLESVALPDLLREAARLAREEDPAPCHVAIDCPDHLPAVRANRMQVEKVLLNLLTNSFEAMRALPIPARQVWMVAALDGAGGGVRVTVRDQGPGIGQEMEHQLFSPFATSKLRGLGLGLTISRALIEAQGGRLWYESASGAGATFHFTLPLAQTP